MSTISTPNPTRQATRHLTAIKASLTAHGVPARLTRIGGTPVLTIKEPTTGPHPLTISVDPDMTNPSALSLDCTAIWTPARDATPEATAATIRAVLQALRDTSCKS